MKKSVISTLILSACMASCVLTTPSFATTATLPAKADLEAAVAAIENFADYAKYYGPSSTGFNPSEVEFYREYEYLNTLASTTYTLIDNYDNTNFTTHNSAAYNDALPAINSALGSCRYLFGIVKSERAATSASISTTTNAASTPTPASTTPTQTSVSLATASSNPSLPNASTGSDSTIAVTATTASQSSDDISSTSDSDDELDIPHTGISTPVSTSSSVSTIIVLTGAAAILAALLAYIFNRRPRTARKIRH